jgi:hypothetical protein
VVTVVMKFPGATIIPEQRPDLTPAGNPTIKKRSKTGINDLYLNAMASNVLATVKETFAVAPGLEEAIVLVVREEDSGPGAGRLVALYAGRFDRQSYRDPWREDPDIQIEGAVDALLKRKGRTKELVALDLDDEPELAQVLEHVAKGVGLEASC